MKQTPFEQHGTELDPVEKAKLTKERKAVQYGDLYKALHHVGDDPVKAEIESILAELLSERAFRTVLAVFNLSSGWKEDADGLPNTFAE